MFSDYYPTEAENLVRTTIKAEKTAWEDGNVWMTDKIGYAMTETVRRARKNYLGIYDEKYDPLTKREKLWVPFTEWTVETMKKNIDVDTKDIEVKAKHPGAYKSAAVFRYVLNHFLDKIRFGKILNGLIANMCIDGTSFAKTWKDGNELMCVPVDRLNLFYDPSAENLDASSAVIERNILTLPEFLELGLPNSDYVEGKKEVERTSKMQSYNTAIKTEVPYVDLYERYGYMSKFALTEKEEDRDKYVYTLSIVSGIEQGGVVFHKIKEVKGHPYDSFWLKRVMNRMDGRGIPEMVASIQAYINQIINIRQNTALVAQMGAWKAKGSITPKDIKQFFETNVIKLGANDEFDRLDTGEVKPSSYNDETTAYSWGQRVTGTSRDDEIAPNKPATNALIEEKSTNKGYGLIQENFFLSLSQMIEKRFVPIIKQILKDGDIVRITGDPIDLKKMDEELVRNYVYRDIENRKSDVRSVQMQNDIVNLVEQGFPLQDAENMYIEGEVSKMMDEISKFGSDRFPEIKKDLFNFEYDIDIPVPDESMNKGAVVQALQTATTTLVNAGVPIQQLKDPFKEMYDIMGLDGEKMVANMNPPAMPNTQVPQEMIGAEQPVPQVRAGAPQMANAPMV